LNTAAEITGTGGSPTAVGGLTGRLVVKRAVYKGHLDTPKGGRSREVPLNATAIEALRAYPRRLGRDWVFPQTDGNFIRKSSARLC